MITISAQSHQGKVRQNNQDAFLIHPSNTCFCLADGMGGYEHGDLASQTLCQFISDFLCKSNHEYDPQSTLVKAFQEGQKELEKKQKALNTSSSMGSTLDVCWFTKDHLYFGHVGDGRIYSLFSSIDYANQRVRYQLIPLTNDHNLTTYIHRGLAQLPQGVPSLNLLSQRQQRMLMNAFVAPYRNPITVELFYQPLQNQSFLFCSDGLHGLVSQEAMEDLFTHKKKEEWLPSLIEAACEAGGDDNITVGLIEVTSERKDPLPPFHKQWWFFKHPDNKLLGPVAEETFSEMSEKTDFQEMKGPQMEHWVVFPQSNWQMFLKHPEVIFHPRLQQAIFNQQKPFWLKKTPSTSAFPSQEIDFFRFFLGLILLIIGIILATKQSEWFEKILKTLNL